MVNPSDYYIQIFKTFHKIERNILPLKACHPITNAFQSLIYQVLACSLEFKHVYISRKYSKTNPEPLTLYYNFLGQTMIILAHRCHSHGWITIYTYMYLSIYQPYWLRITVQNLFPPSNLDTYLKRCPTYLLLRLIQVVATRNYNLVLYIWFSATIRWL